MPKRGRKTDSDRLAAKKIENDILQGLCVRSVSKPADLADQARINTECIKNVEMLEQNMFSELVKHPELTYWLEKATKNTYDPAAPPEGMVVTQFRRFSSTNSRSVCSKTWLWLC